MQKDTGRGVEISTITVGGPCGGHNSRVREMECVKQSHMTIA